MSKSKKYKPTCEVLSSQFEDCEDYTGKSSSSRWPKGKIIWEGEEVSSNKEKKPRKKIDWVARRKMLNMKKQMVKTDKIYIVERPQLLQVPAVMIANEVKVEEVSVIVKEVASVGSDLNVIEQENSYEGKLSFDDFWFDQERGGFVTEDGYLMKNCSEQYRLSEMHPFSSCFYLKGGSKNKVTGKDIDKKMKSLNDRHKDISMYKNFGQNEPIDLRDYLEKSKFKNRQFDKRKDVRYDMSIRALDNALSYSNPGGKVVSFGYEAGYKDPVLDGSSQMSNRGLGQFFEEYRVDSFSCDFRLVNLEAFPVCVVFVPYTYYSLFDFLGLNSCNYDQLRSVMNNSLAEVKILGSVGSGLDVYDFKKEFRFNDIVERWRGNWDINDVDYYAPIGENPLKQNGIFCAVVDIEHQSKMLKGVGVVNFFTSNLELLGASEEYG